MCCYIIANFGVTLLRPILLYYRAILLHYQLAVTLSVNLKLHYRLILHYWALLQFIGRNKAHLYLGDQVAKYDSN